MYTGAISKWGIEVRAYYRKEQKRARIANYCGWRNSMISQTHRQRENPSHYTVESVLTSLGYPDPLVSGP